MDVLNAATNAKEVSTGECVCQPPPQSLTAIELRMNSRFGRQVLALALARNLDLSKELGIKIKSRSKSKRRPTVLDSTAVPSHAPPAGRFGKAIGRVGKRVRLALILALGCLLFFQAHSYAAAEVSREFQIKAALLQWLPYYIEWPPAAFAAKDTPLLIGILGPDPFRQVLVDLLKKKVGDREVKVVRFDSVEDLRDCHILYVNLPDRRDVQRALDLVHGKPVLTVSDQDRFNEQGGMVSLLKYRNHPKPYINNAAARRAGLIIDSRLLTVAEVTEK